MKKLLSVFLLIAMMTTVFAGCGNTNESPSSSGNESREASVADNSTDSSWEKVESAGKLVLGFDSGFPPMGYMDDETGEYVGFDLDIAQEVCNRLGIELEKQPISWSAKEQELDGGNIDCIWNGMSWTEERAEQMLVTEAYMKNNQIILTLADSEFSTMASLADKSVGVQTGSSAEDGLNAEENKAFVGTLKEIIPLENYTTGIMELKQGSIQGIAIDEVVAKHYIEKEPNTFQVIKDESGNQATLAVEDFVIGFRKNDTALKDKIWDTLREMAHDGKLAEISNSWFAEDISTIS